MQETHKIAYRDLGNNGRLGNSLFQVAASIGIADAINSHAIFPYWKYAKYFEGPFDLSLDLETITHIYEEPAFHFTPFDAANCIFRKDGTQVINLQGYFQSEKYWAHCKQKIWDIFKFTPQTIEKTLKHLRNFASTESMVSKKFVSIHFRFGDYKGNPYYKNLLETTYYQEAIKFIKDTENMEHVFFLIFSDEPESAKKVISELHLLPETEFQYAIIRDQKEIYDLCLQSVCHINICANSSFSWWGAYLNREVDHKAIMPNEWFDGTGLTNNTKNLYPKNTIII